MRDPRGNYHLFTNVNTFHARCAQGVECGGHAWSRDGFVFSNLTIGAFGPFITFANGTGWANAYVERPLVTQAADGTPLAFYVGLGRTGYGDCCNWPQLFCTGAAGEACGPTLSPPRPPPPPSPSPAPPSPPMRLRHNAAGCLVINSSALAPPARAPCWDAGSAVNWGCALEIGDCGSPAAVWFMRGGALVSNATLPAPHTHDFVAVNFDCDRTTPGTPVWALADAGGGNAPHLALAGGKLGVAGSDACLGALAPRAACGPQQPWVQGLASAVTVVSCAHDASATGWTAETAL
jgi:hypothetical protein